MSNPENDSRLEQLSREAADRYTVKASPSWDTMERELDKVLPTEKKKRRPFFFWWIIPGVLLGGVALWYTSLKQKVSEKDPVTETSIHEIKKEPATTNATIQEKTQYPLISKPSLSTYKTEKRITATKKYTGSSSFVNAGKRKNNSLTTQQDESSATNSSNQLFPITTEEKKATAASVSITTTDKSESIRPTIDTGSNMTDKSILALKDSTSNTAIQTQEPITVDTKDSAISKNKKEKGGFAFTLVAGMDATTVKFRYADKASLSGGILIGYYLDNNWSIYTGGLFTRKNYKMAGSDFKAPAGSWIANYKLETVDGFCNMWEVPLLLRYTFDSKTKTKAFISTGLSSYFMTRENYNYFYYYNGTPVRRNVNYPNGKTHLFSILKLSTGWVRETGKHSSMIIEPFANLPLSGLGFGSVKLSSFGINFSYQFRQPNKKK
ncbi:hypothetical protein KACHI17_02810 [Sediminibacterium sp. KACHI17]|uniref:Outer membrane protein beta-barrel domain-containing protein n=1 Tax=Sediminibacterium sp. KACHI17 TaxID=1751071 RepID=A0AAT9GFJ1_9BACT